MRERDFVALRAAPALAAAPASAPAASGGVAAPTPAPEVAGGLDLGPSGAGVLLAPLREPWAEAESAFTMQIVDAKAFLPADPDPRPGPSPGDGTGGTEGRRCARLRLWSLGMRSLSSPLASSLRLRCGSADIALPSSPPQVPAAAPAPRPPTSRFSARSAEGTGAGAGAGAGADADADGAGRNRVAVRGLRLGINALYCPLGCVARPRARAPLLARL